MSKVVKFILSFCLICVLIFFAACEGNQQNTEPSKSPAETMTQPQNIIENTYIEPTESSNETVTQTELEQTEDVSCPTNEIIVPKDNELVEINVYIPNIIIDLKYATVDNFTGQQIYDSEQKAMLRYGTTVKLLEAQKELNSLGYTIVVWDAYRPTYAQFKLWDVCPDPRYVANPTNGGFSSHSRGNTIDITICKLDGSKIEMPTKFDDFSKEADRDYSDISKAAAENSKLLEDVMKKHGFVPYSAEWWHFSDSNQYDVIKEGQ